MAADGATAAFLPPTSSSRPNPSSAPISRPILRHTQGSSALREATSQDQSWIISRPPRAHLAPREQGKSSREPPPPPSLLSTSPKVLRFPFRVRVHRPKLPDMPPPLQLTKPVRCWYPGTLDPSFKTWCSGEAKTIIRSPQRGAHSASLEKQRGLKKQQTMSHKRQDSNRPAFWTLSAASKSSNSSDSIAPPTTTRSFATSTSRSSTATISLQSATAQASLEVPRKQIVPDPLQVTLEKLRTLFASEDTDGQDSQGSVKEQQGKVNRAIQDIQDAKRIPLEYTPVRVQDSYEHPRLPCVFLHGLFGFSTLTPLVSLPQLTFDYWRGVVEVLEKNGVEVLVTNVTTSASIEERARDAAKMIEERFPGREVNLLGHSMGGLDSRFLAACIKDRTFKVATVTTIATPHRGSPFASYLLYNVIGRKRLPTLLNLVKTVGIPGGGKAFEDLTTERMRDFNELCKDVEGTKYYSWGAAFRPGVLNEFRWPWSVVWEQEGHNDGLVSVWSAAWGQYMGTLKGSHIEIIGWGNAWATMSANLMGKEAPFDSQNFYLHVCEDLARDGF